MKNKTIHVRNDDWTTKALIITNRTTRRLTTGKVIPTWSNMVRKARKV